MHAGLDENQAELGVHVLVVALQVLADAHGLLDEAVEVLGDLRGEAWSRPMSTEISHQRTLAYP